MGRYIAYRLWIAIPTILAVLIIAFLLMQSAPGDSVERQLGLEGENIRVSRTLHNKAYKTKALQLGTLLPDFYISIIPNYFPDNINQIYPNRKRELGRKLLRESHDWNQTSLILDEIDEMIIAIEDLQGNRSLKSELLKLELSQSATDLQARINHLVLPEDLPTSIREPILQLKTAINGLSRVRNFSYPTIRWNGSQSQFHYWMSQVIDGDNYKSLIDGRPVWTKVKEALKWTLSISIISLTLIGLLSLLIAYLQVLHNNKLWDRISSSALYLMYAMPLFWFCTLMVVFFTTKEYGAWTNIFPSVGIRPSFGEEGFLSRFFSQFGQLILPIVCIVIHALAYLTRQTKRDMLDNLDKPYVTAARAKGLSFPQVLKLHVLRDALLPFTTLMTGAIPTLFTGSVVVEVIFNIPGIGRLMLESVNNSDWPVAMSILIIVSIATILGYLFGDLLLVKLYPRTIHTFLHKDKAG